MAKYKDCDDPIQLAAAIEAGVRVDGVDGGWPSRATTVQEFSDSIQRGVKYRVPDWWTPEWTPPERPIAKDDRVKHIDGWAGTVLEVHESSGMAWVLRDHIKIPFTYLIVSLTRIEDE